MGRTRKGKRSDEGSSSDTARKKKHGSEGRIGDCPAKGDQGKLKSYIGITQNNSSSQNSLDSVCMNEETNYETDSSANYENDVKQVPIEQNDMISNIFCKLIEQNSKLENEEKLGEDLKECLVRKMSKESPNVIVNIKCMSNKIKQLTKENKKLRKMIEIVPKTNLKASRLEEEMEAIKKSVKDLKEGTQQPKTYAGVSKGSAIEPPMVQGKKLTSYSVIISPRNGKSVTSSEETKEILMKSFVPSEENIRISGLKKTSNNQVILETTRMEEMQRVLKSKKLKAANLKASLPVKRRPLLIVYGVSAELDEEKFLLELRRQNFQHMPEEKYKTEVKFSHKTGKRNLENDHRVIEVTLTIRETLLKQGSAYLGWTSHRVKDYVSVSRCYKCQSFGHVSKFCKAKVETCGHCGLQGHTFKNCPKAEEKQICINCKRESRSYDHSSRSAECPAYTIALANYIAKFDYGQ